MIQVHWYSDLVDGMSCAHLFDRCDSLLTDIARICPGRYFVDATLWVAMAQLLAVFDISSPLDAEGKPTGHAAQD